MSITTLDNPGWHIKIDLEGTDAEGREKARSVVSDSPDAWLQYGSDGYTVNAACGPAGLGEALAVLVGFLRGDPTPEDG